MSYINEWAKGEGLAMIAASDLPKMRIDIISDVMCPWCVIGYLGLQQALEELKGELDAEIHWQPFELNPQMPKEGQDLSEHIAEKYGSSAKESKANRERIVALGAALDFDFNFTAGMRIVNTFNAHQLLHWVGETSERQLDLQVALFNAYFSYGRDVNDLEVLVDIANGLSLDVKLARQVLVDQIYASDVRALQEQWRQLGVSAVPSFIINDTYMISGGQSAQTFVQKLRRIMAD